MWTTVNTYISTINSALHCEADIDLVDISLDDYNLDIKSLEQKLKIAKMKKITKSFNCCSFSWLSK